MFMLLFIHVESSYLFGMYFVKYFHVESFVAEER